MPATKNVREIKTGETAVLKRDQRLRWEKHNGAKTYWGYTDKNIYDVLDSDGHRAKITVRYESHYLRVDLKCSCGHSLENQGLTWGGKLNSWVVTRWTGHKEVLASPLTVWESTSARQRYKCIIASDGAAAGLMAKHDADRWNSWNAQGTYRFCVVRTSESLKTGKIASRRWMNTHITLTDALQYARKIGIAAERSGQVITWVEESPVAKPTGEASAIIAAIESANDPSAILNAVKLADSFLDYAQIIQQSREAALRRLDGLLSMAD
jgi:hypothetical protein